MGNAQIVFYIVAVCVLLVGAILDPRRFNVTRCITLALALVLLAQMPILR